MDNANSLLAPGDLVRHPRQADWGVGQVQSVAGDRLTVNFEGAGKQVLDGRVVALDYVGQDPRA